LRKHEIIIASSDEACIRAVRDCVSAESMELWAARTREDYDRLAAGREVDLIMLDISEPGGFERKLLREIGGGPRKTPLIAVASLADLDQEVCQTADEFLSKPIVPLEYNVRLKSVLGLKKLNEYLAKYTREETEEIPATAPPKKKPRILIVDDSRFERMQLMHILAEEDCDILTAADGEEALTLAEKLAPDLIILDVVLPGMDGYIRTIPFEIIPSGSLGLCRSCWPAAVRRPALVRTSAVFRGEDMTSSKKK